MTNEDWGRRVDALVIEAGISRFALDGRNAADESLGRAVAAEHFRRPKWTSNAGSVHIDDQSGGGQPRAVYLPITADSTTQAPIPGGRTYYYNRDEAGARRAAAEIAAFLADGTLPSPHTGEP